MKLDRYMRLVFKMIRNVNNQKIVACIKMVPKEKQKNTWFFYQAKFKYNSNEFYVKLATKTKKWYDNNSQIVYALSRLFGNYFFK